MGRRLAGTRRRAGWPPYKSEGGTFVARKRPTASDPPQSRRPRTDVGTTRAALTRAEARALLRSAPLTPAEFREKRRMAAQLVDPLPMLLGTEQGGESPNPGGT